jgi:hypothetical protein
MTVEEMKIWAIANKKGLIVGLIAGFVLKSILK